MSYLLVFLSVGAAEVFWTLYFMAIADRQPLHAGLYSAFIIGCGMFTTVSYVGNHRLGWAAVAAALVFTYLTVRFKKEPAPKVSDIAAQIRKELLEVDEWESYP